MSLLSPMLGSALLAVIAMGTGCADRRIDDSELGNLIHAETDQAGHIDVEGAATNVSELVGALAAPHARISDQLGAHRVRGRSAITVSREGVNISELSDTTEIVLDRDGGFRAVSDNSHDYGRHAIYAAGTLYLRPRYGKYHRRPPATDDEPAAIRDEMFSTVSAYFDLLYARAELSDRGVARLGDRATRRIDISTAPEPAMRAPAALPQKSWRDSISVESVTGVVSLDTETGFPLAATIKGTITYLKDGKSYRMELEASHAITDIGSVEAVAAPDIKETVSTPITLDEVDEQRQLLEGLAPAGSTPSPKESP